MTGSTQPQVCHIVPFALNNCETNRQHTRNLLRNLDYFLGSRFHLKVKDLLQVSVGCSDQGWNMLCLHQQLRYWWSKARWAFKLLGITPRGEFWCVQLQFHWMPFGKRNFKEPIEISNKGIQRLLESTPSEYSDFAARVDSSRPVQSGHTFEVLTDPSGR